MPQGDYYVMLHPYLYVVLEHSVGMQDAIVHGVYIKKEYAQGKIDKLKKQRKDVGYLSLLKKPINGLPALSHGTLYDYLLAD